MQGKQRDIVDDEQFKRFSETEMFSSLCRISFRACNNGPTARRAGGGPKRPTGITAIGRRVVVSGDPSRLIRYAASARCGQLDALAASRASGWTSRHYPVVRADQSSFGS